MTVKNTENELRAALDRLVNRNPRTKANKLKVQAGKSLKITVSGVEKEAGKANGATKYYPKLIEDIGKAEALRLHCSGDSSEETPVQDVKESPIYKQMEHKLTQIKRAKKKAEDTVAELREECNRKEAALNEKVAELDEIIAFMFDVVPKERLKEFLIDKTDNVIALRDDK
ncbi:conserved hypothetical protein [Vibrio chagasii]|nr:conserved hypothetical protein [Vibrio chagasii]